MTQKKKQTSKRKGSRKTAATTPSGTRTIRYYCDPFCSASEPKKRAKRSNIVKFITNGSGVTIDFDASNPSPFVSGDRTFTIVANSRHQEIVRGNAAYRNYDYTLTCDTCQDDPNPDNPQLIVEP